MIYIKTVDILPLRCFPLQTAETVIVFYPTFRRFMIFLVKERAPGGGLIFPFPKKRQKYPSNEANVLQENLLTKRITLVIKRLRSFAIYNKPNVFD